MKHQVQRLLCILGQPAHTQMHAQALEAGCVGMRDAGTGLLGATLDVDTAAWVRPAASIGAGSDSFHEYLLKVRRGELLLGCIRGSSHARKDMAYGVLLVLALWRSVPPSFRMRARLGALRCSTKRIWLV